MQAAAKERADAQAEAQRIRGQGDAEALSILAGVQTDERTAGVLSILEEPGVLEDVADEEHDSGAAVERGDFAEFVPVAGDGAVDFAAGEPEDALKAPGC